MILTITYILIGLIAINFFLLLFSINKTSPKGKRPQEKFKIEEGEKHRISLPSKLAS